MKKVLFSAIAGSAILLAGCEKKEEVAAVEASPVAEASADAGASEAASGDADAAAAEEGGNETTSGGPRP